ncbi:ABC transporter ATP-binding protein [Deferrisoma sp.]
MRPLLEVRNLTKEFGGLRANEDVSFDLGEGEILGLIGPNGAGKTTLFHCLTGFHKPDRGTVRFDGRDITGLPPHKIARLGIARTFQNFVATGDLSVLETVMVGCFARTASPSKARAKAGELLSFLGLADLAGTPIRDLPVAGQKTVALATALGTEPRLLLLDEVAAGLNPGEIQDLMGAIRHVHQELGVTLIVIEHVMELVMNLSHRVLVLDSGRVIAQGPPEEVAHDPAVIRAYLGEKYAARYLEGAPS